MKDGKYSPLILVKVVDKWSTIPIMCVPFCLGLHLTLRTVLSAVGPWLFTPVQLLTEAIYFIKANLLSLIFFQI